MKKTMLLTLLSLSFGLNSTIASADEVPAKTTEDLNAVVIVFKPPQGMEKEFLESFAKEQAANFKSHSENQKGRSESINLIPTKEGEPLIHITILKDKKHFDETYKNFGPRENRGAYVGKHSEKYGDLKIPKIYLQNSQSYFAKVVE
ncbi:hypothetical protein TRE132_55190 [Pseudomonas chlororaphis subsp. aurantiaca]|uniref:hypothetical protein n=1 Tax=Pseudomonas chlororaphis TaxID=587753 RepID=UPI001BF06DA3|nr:hypothetical protein TRE132_55190 [Pseudomonas chlororaphis subsp. aurantiaca]